MNGIRTHIRKNPLDNIHHNLYSLASKLMEIGYWFGLSFEQDKLFLLHYPQWQHLLPTAANHKHHFLLLFPRQAAVEAKAQCVELKFSWRLFVHARLQGMRWHGCSGCTNLQIFGTSPFAPADFEAFSTMCTR